MLFLEKLVVIMVFITKSLSGHPIELLEFMNFKLIPQLLKYSEQWEKKIKNINLSLMIAISKNNETTQDIAVLQVEINISDSMLCHFELPDFNPDGISWSIHLYDCSKKKMEYLIKIGKDGHLKNWYEYSKLDNDRILMKYTKPPDVDFCQIF